MDDYISEIAIVCNLLLGLIVIVASPGRSSSRTFFLLTLSIACWIYSIDKATGSVDATQAEFWIRACSFFGPLVIAQFALLRISVIRFQDGWAKHVWRARGWLGIGLFFACLCWTRFFLDSVEIHAVAHGTRMAPRPIYGNGNHLYLLYILVGGLGITGLLLRDQFDRRIQGIRRVELQFVALALVFLVASVGFSAVCQVSTGNTALIKYGPLRIIVFDAIITYGITSRGILDVRAASRLALSYLLLASYTAVICTACWYALQRVFFHLNIQSDFAVALCSGVLVALLVNSTGTPLRRISRKILPSSDVDFETTVASVAHIVQTVTTFSELLNRFTVVLRRAVGTPGVSVFLLSPDGFHGHNLKSDKPEHIPLLDLVSVRVRAGATDLAVEDLQRRAPCPERDALLARMEAVGADLIVPVSHHGKLSGLLMLAPRQSGRLYGTTGRATLRLIAEQLGVAVANSRLYTEARQSQAYNQFLVEHLSCGVIATDPVGNLTVVNPEARRVLQLDEGAPPAEIELPPDMAGLIAPTLEGDAVARNEEIILRPGARDQAHIRVSCLSFSSETNELLGAVLVINDHTTLEQLQRQVRQADRLASIGTLASGMAHEIKNPLTALKTFTQLLPKRYNDAEFRHDFSGLAGSEIARIERIVNQLLAFARPAPLMIEQVALHDIIDGAMRLVGPQASRQQVSVRKSLRADHDFIAADKDRLQQVLLNLLLNALQASESGGYIELATEMELGPVDHEPLVRLDVRDNGIGISEDLLPHIFDPFFTTKSEGTGLGLSVSYNIVAEHKGRLEVRSEPGKGTCFSMYLPVC